LGRTRRSGVAVAYRRPRISYRRSPENTSSTHSGEAFSTMPHLPKRGHIGQTVNARGFTYDNCCALQPLLECQRKGQGTWIVYCCPTAAKAPDMDIGCFYFLRDLQARKRADERTRTADLLITSVRSVVAEGCSRLQIPHKQRDFCSLCCPLLQSVACGLGSN
jgi:hypothetical protein